MEWGPFMTPALEVNMLRKSFGGLPVTSDVSFQVMPGERRLILGPNGAGKTTLFNLITGDLKADAGSIKLFGTEMIHMGVHQRTHLSLARTYQIITLFNKDSLLHNVVLSLMGLSPTRWNVFSHLGRHAHFEEEAMRVLNLVGLDRAAQRPVSEVAYGDGHGAKTQAVAAGRALGRIVQRRAGAGQRLGGQHSARNHRGDDRARHGHRPGFGRAFAGLALWKSDCGW
jgi:ABC-type branched-subunit amino acid transport system ATPase component